MYVGKFEPILQEQFIHDPFVFRCIYLHTGKLMKICFTSHYQEPFGCASCVKVIDARSEIREPCSNSALVCCVHYSANTCRKDTNTFL